MLKRIAIALLLVACSLSQWAASPVRAQDEDLFADKEVLIGNRTNTAVSFYLKNDKTNWVLFVLSPGALQLYKNTDQIYIRSTNGAVNYRLVKNKRYRIIWNSERQLYDLVRLK